MFNECLDIGWKTAHFCILNFSFKNYFVWEEISNIRHSVSSPDETPRSSSKILRYASYFQLSSRCFIWWWNTASHVWYITWNTSKFVKNTPLRVVFSTLFSVFHLVMKHCVSCLIYYISYTVFEEIKWVKQALCQQNKTFCVFNSGDANYTFQVLSFLKVKIDKFLCASLEHKMSWIIERTTDVPSLYIC